MVLIVLAEAQLVPKLTLTLSRDNGRGDFWVYKCYKALLQVLECELRSLNVIVCEYEFYLNLSSCVKCPFWNEPVLSI